MAAQMRFEYVSGSVGIGRRAGLDPRRGYADFCAYNRGGVDEYVSIQLVRWASFPQTKVAWSIGPQLIRPTEAHLLEYSAEEFDGTRYWARIRVTSENLVPSVAFRIQDDPASLESIRQVVYFGPEDFRKYTLRIRPGEPVTDDQPVVHG